MLKLFAFFLLLAYSFSVYSQDEPENGFYAGAFEGLEYSIPNLEAKYDLNTIDLNTLLTFSFLNSQDAARLLEHKKRFGVWRCVEELQTCTFLRSGQMDSLKSMVFVAKNYFPSSKPANKFQANLACRYLQKDSFTAQQLPDLLAIRTQFKFQFDDLKSFNFSAERDAGEAWIYNKSPHPFDYCAFTFSGLNKSSSIRYFVGDYEVLFGYGLGLYQGYLLSSRNAWNGIQASAQLFKAHTSMRENGYCEGLAIEWNRKNLTVGAFMSYRRLDNNLLNKQISASQAFQSNGVHVSGNSQAARQSVAFYQLGTEIKYTLKQGAVAGYLLAHVMPNNVLLVTNNVFLFSRQRPLMQSGLCGHATIFRTYFQAEILWDNFNNMKGQLKMVHPFYGGDLYLSVDDFSQQQFNLISSPSALTPRSRSININWQSPLFLKSCKVNVGGYYKCATILRKDEASAQSVLHLRCERALSKKQMLVFTWQERWDYGVWSPTMDYFPKREDFHSRYITVGAKSEETGLGAFSWFVEMSLSNGNKVDGVLSSCRQKFRLRHVPGTWNVECLFYQIKEYQNRMYLLREEWPGSLIQTAYYGDGLQTQISTKVPFFKHADVSLFLGKKWQFSPSVIHTSYLLVSIQIRV